MTHPVFINGIAPSKANARAFLPVFVPDADTVRGTDFQGSWLLYVKTLDAWFERDTSDTTSADNGTSVLVGPNGERWIATTGSSVAVDIDAQVDDLADRDAFDNEDEGFSVLVSDVGDGRAAIYSKASNASADWTEPAYFTGPEGADGAPGSSDVVGTSTSSVTISTGSKIFTVVESGRGWGLGARLRVASDANPSVDWMEGVLTDKTDPAITVLVDRFGGSGTHTDWTINLAGEPGQDGQDGTPGAPGADGVVQSIVAGANVTVDETDPANPVISASGGGSFRNTWDLVDEFGFDPSGTDGTEAANDAALDLFIAHAALNPGGTYRARKGDIFRISATNKSIPGDIRLALEGAQFLWEGTLGTSDPILEFGDGLDFDAIRMEIVSGGDFQNALDFLGNNRGDLIELIAQAQVNNGDALDTYGVRLLGDNEVINRICIKNVDRALHVYGTGGDGVPCVDNIIHDIDVENYVTGAYFRNQVGLRILSANIRGRSANAASDPGHNGILCEGVRQSIFQAFRIANSGEHGFRWGGRRNSEEFSYDNVVKGGVIRNSGQTGFKMFTGHVGERFRRCAISTLTITDSADDGDAPGFNDHGLMLQQTVDCTVENVTIAKDALTYSSYDGVFISGASNLRMDAVSAFASSRNGCRISEWDDGTGSAEVETLSCNGVKAGGFKSENHVEEGIYVDCPATNMRDIHFENLTLVGATAGSPGVYWSGAIGRAAQPCRFAGIIRGHTTKFSVPSGANIKTLDYMA